MSSFFYPSIARVPNLLSTGAALSNINRTNVSIFRTSTELSTNRSILRPSDDTVKAAAIQTLDDRLELSDQRLRNIEFADRTLSTLDSALGESNDILTQARSLALEQLNVGTTGEERRSQADVIASMLDSLFRVANRESLGGYVFGGTRPSAEPVTQIGNSYRFDGETAGLVTDISPGRAVPVTVGASNAVGAISGRVRGAVDLDPQLTDDTRLSDIAGARGLGVSLGRVNFAYDGGPDVAIDLAGADTIGDVMDRLTAAIRTYEEDNDVEVLGPGGVQIVGTTIQVDSPSGPLLFSDPTGGVTARDLGLATQPNEAFGPQRSATESLAPRLTLRTPLDQLGAIADPLGTIRVRNAGQAVDVDLAAAETLGDVKRIIEAETSGIRVEIDGETNTINLFSEVSGAESEALSIEDVSPADATASRLGIRTLAGATRVADLNFGRGVGVVGGNNDPRYNVDFTVTLGDGFAIDIDLTEDDLITVETVLDAINSQANAQLVAAGRDADEFSAGISGTVNGIVLRQADGIGGRVQVAQRNNSPAASGLGLLDGTWNATNNTLTGEDRSAVRAESAFSYLSDLRTALESNDETGIRFAVDDLAEAIDRLSVTRAQVGGYARRVVDERDREEERFTVDEQTRSQLRDLDFASAASRYSLLQTQLQAGLQTAAISNQLTLLNFIG